MGNVMGLRIKPIRIQTTQLTSACISPILFRKISDQNLKDESKEIAQKIMELVESRQAGEPHVDFNDFQNTTNRMIRHSQETQNLYAKDYAGKVHALRDEFLKRSLQNEDLDRFYQHPTNYLGLKALAIGLAALSEQLKVT